jgi:hypothetical protein
MDQVDTDVNQEGHNQLQLLVTSYSDVFSHSEFDLGQRSLI